MKELGPNHSAILTGGKVKTLLSRVVKSMVVLMLINGIGDNISVNAENEDNPGHVLQNQVVDGVNVDMVNEDNPGQALQNQVGDNGNVDNLEQVLLSLEDVNAVDAIDAAIKENAVDAETEENAIDAVNAEIKENAADAGDAETEETLWTLRLRKTR
jgi:hypothetical protein